MPSLGPLPCRLLLRFIALLSLGAMGTGCYVDPVNGEDNHFQFAGPPAAALGERVTLRVAHAEKELELCGKGSCGDLFPRRAPRIEGVVVADSDDPSCAVEAGPVDSGVVELTVQCAGAARPRVHLAARVADGTVVEDHFHVAFLAAERISVFCIPGNRCGGSIGVFPGAALGFNARVESADGTPLYTGHIEVSVEGEVVTIVGEPGPAQQSQSVWVGPIPFPAGKLYPSWQVMADARLPGRTAFHLAAGGVSRDLPVLVADPAEVIDATIAEQRAGDRFGWDDPVEVDSETATPLDLGGLHERGNLTGELLLTLADGNRAWGGADFLSVDSGGALYISRPLGAPAWSGSRVYIAGRKTGTGTVIFDAGGAHREWTIDVGK